ncbi:GGDEF domain-containing protein [Ferrimonas kyonanensis]|uniref:GGDEF domain-containing protein n=1 Tax=Ferrimonas kyonanensis TaxID=364763 RepID=UPI00040E4977|nr:GGDEF domain-containing protein [Ferrimonas kyonanensis]
MDWKTLSHGVGRALSRGRQLLLAQSGGPEHSPFWQVHFNGLVNNSARTRALKLLLLVTLLTFYPLGIKNLLIGEWLLASGCLLFGVVLSAELLSVLKRNQGLLGYPIPAMLLVALTLLTLYTLGPLGSYWLFPIAMGLVFFAPPRVSLTANLWIIAGSAVIGFSQMPPLLALRMMVALIICVCVAHFVMNAVVRLHTELLSLSTRDALTQALNRTQLESFLSSSLAYERQATIAMLDIDNFKAINDRHGHDVGDRVITEVVACINRHTRQGDLVFRLGGDEFLILFSHTDVAQSAMIIDKLRRAIESEHFNSEVSVTISAGLQSSFAHTEVAQWLKDADVALYQAKRQGRNCVVTNEQPV